MVEGCWRAFWSKNYVIFLFASWKSDNTTSYLWHNNLRLLPPLVKPKSPWTSSQRWHFESVFPQRWGNKLLMYPWCFGVWCNLDNQQIPLGEAGNGIRCWGGTQAAPTTWTAAPKPNLCVDRLYECINLHSCSQSYLIELFYRFYHVFFDTFCDKFGVLIWSCVYLGRYVCLFVAWTKKAGRCLSWICATANLPDINRPYCWWKRWKKSCTTCETCK